ncbi:hypothetical protein [Caulobacter radicis]|uniref:hypothetical protein n=1 Tax=Caulobacter radicis TaxID=2172650 RepID=UPI0010577D3F|nr:hypothetical protein [Caulobacter radicis]
MDDPALNKTSGQLRADIMKLVIANDVDSIPEDLPDDRRFFVSSVKAAAHAGRAAALTVFVYSEMPRDEAGAGSSRMVHMQDGHGNIASRVVFTGRDSNNGWAAQSPIVDLATTFDEIEAGGFGDRCIVVWDGQGRRATCYPAGVIQENASWTVSVPLFSGDVTQDEICGALNEIYNEHMKTPSSHTVKVWLGGKLNQGLEDEIERHLKGGIQAYFSGRSRRVKILAQTNTSAGRTDLVILQRASLGAGPTIAGVLELKVLRGGKADEEVTLEGLQQGHAYRAELELPFCTLALYDVGTNLTHDASNVLAAAPAHLKEAVRVRRFPLYRDPASWRKAGSYTA